jgi:hypothetical protein
MTACTYLTVQGSTALFQPAMRCQGCRLCRLRPCVHKPRIALRIAMRHVGQELKECMQHKTQDTGHRTKQETRVSRGPGSRRTWPGQS